MNRDHRYEHSIAPHWYFWASESNSSEVGPAYLLVWDGKCPVKSKEKDAKVLKILMPVTFWNEVFADASSWNEVILDEGESDSMDSVLKSRKEGKKK